MRWYGTILACWHSSIYGGAAYWLPYTGWRWCTCRLPPDPGDVGTYHAWDGCTAYWPSAVVETAVAGYA